MTFPILSVAIDSEEDVVIVRQRAHQIARLLEFEEVEQTRVATAVSEIARNAYEYAKGGKAEFYIDEAFNPPAFCIRISDKGGGISRLEDILEGRYQSSTGMGVGITGTRRLMDIFNVETTPKGTSVVLGKNIPRPQTIVSRKSLNAVAEQLARQIPYGPIQEVQRQNQEIFTALKELERRQSELSRLNQELAETNRGVVALYAELDSRAEEAQRADAVKTRFLSHMTHEFRTPVNSVLNLTRFLLDRTDGELTGEQEKQIKLIQKSMENLSEMVNDLLDLAKVEAGKVTMRIEEFTVSELFASLRGMFRPLAKNPDVELIFEDPKVAIALKNDEGKISQILRNFVSNALKFTEKGEIRVTASQDTSSFVAFTVMDTGIGISQEDQPRIFEEFGQIENRIQKKVKGTGLGLPLSKKLAEVLRGSITVESAVGRGSRFSLVIPSEMQEQVSPNESAFVKPSPLDMQSGFRALIIDDDEATCYTLRRSLAALNWTVEEARNGSAGIEAARETLPELIFLDLMMPDMSGFEVLELLKREPKTQAIPVVIHTSQNLSPSERAGLSQLASGILQKDAQPEQFIAFMQGLFLPKRFSEAS